MDGTNVDPEALQAANTPNEVIPGGVLPGLGGPAKRGDPGQEGEPPRITGLHTRHKIKLTDIWSDTIYVSIYATYKNDMREKGREMFRSKKLHDLHDSKMKDQLLKASHKEGWNPTVCIFGGRAWSVGHAVSQREGKVIYEHSITHGYLTLLLHFGSYDKADNRPNISVMMGSNYLSKMVYELDAWTEVVSILELEGIVIDDYVIQRLDLCRDVLEADIKSWAQKFVKRDYVSYLKKGGQLSDSDYLDEKERKHYKNEKLGVMWSGMEWTGGYIGLLTQFKFYEKIIELRGQPVKAWYHSNMRWGGVYPTKAIRGEFRILSGMMRDIERDIGALQFDELFYLKKRSIWRHMCNYKFRFTRDHVDRKNRHQDRTEIHWLWKKFAAVDGDFIKINPVRKTYKCNMDRAEKLAISNLITATKFSSGKTPDLEDLLQKVRESYHKFNDNGLYDRYTERTDNKYICEVGELRHLAEENNKRMEDAERERKESLKKAALERFKNMGL